MKLVRWHGELTVLGHNQAVKMLLYEHDKTERLDQITRATNELNRCVRERGQPGMEMATLGEVDWLCELHNLLYEKGGK